MKSSYPMTEKEFARLFSDFTQKECCYNTTARQWMYYDGKRWTIDEGGMYVAGKAKAFTDELLSMAKDIEDDQQRNDFFKIVIRYCQYRNRETLIKDARDLWYFKQSAFDTATQYFNCQNGTYNLETGEFIKHSPYHMLTKLSNVVYDPNERSELWLRYLCDVMENDAEMVEYLQKLSGLCLTDITSNETCHIFPGPTRSGKSTFLETILFMFGGEDGYGCSMRPETLALRQNRDTRQASGDIARLDGCRLLISSEPPKRMVFDVALLKSLLGRDSITARRLYQSEFSFVPQFKLIMATNFLPLITDDTLFTSGRITVVPFNRRFEPHEQDHALKDRLKTRESISGIFNWALEGLRKYRESGLKPTQKIIEATEQYRKSSDKLGRFIEDCLSDAEGMCVSAGQVYERYTQWCAECGHGCESKGHFFDDLRSKGLFSTSGTVNGKTVRNVVRDHILLPVQFMQN